MQATLPGSAVFGLVSPLAEQTMRRAAIGVKADGDGARVARLARLAIEPPRLY